MVPRLKITSLETDEIDPQCVVGFITVLTSQSKNDSEDSSS